MVPLLLISCSESQNGITLSEFSFNGKNRNEWIINKVPDYGTSNRDGCEILKEISVELEAAGDKYTGRIFDSKSNSGLAKVKIMVQYGDETVPAETFSDEKGKIAFTSAGNFERLIFWHTEYRSLIIQSPNKKLPALIN